MSLPDFLVVGAAKCGSTTLTAMLAQHPDVFLPPHEVGFFALDHVYERGIGWYEGLFADAGEAARRGENSNHYTMAELYPEAFPRLVRHLGASDLRIIYLVRHPLRRIESHWIEKRSHGGDEVHHDFNRAVFANRERLLDPSDYWRQLAPYRRHLGDDRILVVLTEELEAEPREVLQRCFAFLDVDPFEVDIGVRLNPSSSKRVQRPALSRLRRLPLYASVAARLPPDLRASWRRRLFFAAVDGRPTWDPAVRAAAVEELRAGTAEILAYAGRSEDTWPLAG